LPGSGKSTLAGKLAPALNLPHLDKDVFLENLFESRGTGDVAWRRALSRESDQLLQSRATESEGAVLDSFWHLPGMPADSGTPTEWLRNLSCLIVNVHCCCSIEVAAMRFLQRKRHPGHRDADLSFAEILARLQATARLGPLDIGPRIDVDTSGVPDLDLLVRDLRRLFTAES
jgi:predicted kinase